jgi:sugar lactone lactonase YvrE
MAADRKVTTLASVGSVAGAVALAGDGSLLVGDGPRLLRVGIDGKVQTLANDLGDIYGVAIGPGGEMYVADWEGGRVLKMKNGKRTVVASKLEYPSGLVLDSKGELYVKESGRQTDKNLRVRRIDETGNVVIFATVELNR